MLCDTANMDTKEFRTPGQLIESLLKERSWNNRVLANVLEIDETGVSKIIANKKVVTPELAIALEEVFGIPADRFLALQRDLDLKRARLVAMPNPARAARAQMLAQLPIAEMIKRSWLAVEDSRDITGVETAVQKFFGTQNLSELTAMPHAARRAAPEKTDISPVQLAWLYRVHQIASGLISPPYSKSATVAALPRLKDLLSAPEEARHVPRILNECGIRFVAVEGLRASKIDGVCMWLDERSPVIGMTMRFDRMDNFWFVLRHELEHVIQRHGVTMPKLDVDLGESSTEDDEERVANEAAASFCVPQARIDSFIARKAPLFAERDFLGLAKILNVHPSLIAGQIQFKTGRYDLFRSHIAKVRDHVLPSAIVDGWGDLPPLS